jgi:CII-binding regulator of phage lambda lysogenization HflD
MKQVKEGSITVFLSLILLLILAVIMTTIEAARVSTAKAYTERALSASMDSVLAEYYLPLFQEYHIFGLDASYGMQEIDEETMISKLENNMEYTFMPNKDLSLRNGYIPMDDVNLFGIQTSNTNIEQINTLLDYDGELFTDQAVSYMKYKEVGDIFENFIKNSSKVKETNAVEAVLNKKQVTEESLYQIDEKVLELMRLIDGISISEKGVELNNQEQIVIKDKFVKEICTLPVTMENIHINNPFVFSSLKNYYINPLEIIGTASDNIDDLIENISLKEQAKERYDDLKRIDRSKITDENKLKKLKKKLANAKKTLQKYTDREKTLLNSLNDELDTLNNMVSGTLSSINSSLPVVDELLIKQEIVTNEITDYESFLSANREGIDDNFYRGLMDDLTNIQKYKKTDSVTKDTIDDYNFEEMKNTLLKNKSILLNIKKYPKASATESTLNELKLLLNSSRNSFEGYSHNGLQFDYSTLAKPAESDSFFSCIQNLMQDGIMSLIIDTDKVSKKEIVSDLLPSKLHEVSENKEPFDISEQLANLNLNSKIGSLTDVFSNLGSNIDLTGAALAGGEAVGQALLLQEYLVEHFSEYNLENTENNQKALNYELEYILMGRSTDYNNLKSIITRIILIRTIMNLITLFADTKSSGEARTLAISFVGFTGLPALVMIIKTAILAIWSFTEALIDVAALLQNKSVPLLKTGNDIQLKLNEIFLLNKAYIETKVSKMKETAGTAQLKYKDYLRLFLFMEGKEKKSYRAMDLIQENIQNKYEDTFYLKNCIFGFRASAKFQMNSKFVSLPFVRQLIDFQDEGYIFKSTQEYSY